MLSLILSSATTDVLSLIQQLYSSYFRISSELNKKQGSRPSTWDEDLQVFGAAWS